MNEALLAEFPELKKELLLVSFNMMLVMLI